MPVTDPFEFTDDGSDVIYGRGAVDRLDEVLADHGLDRALVVCGSNVGANSDLMEPLEHALGDRLIGVFDGTTPEKLAEDVYAGIHAMEDAEAEVLVGVGGGSSLDTARQMSALAADGRTLSDLRAELHSDGLIRPPEPADPTPVVVLPTTFAGADVSSGGSIEVLSQDDSPTDQPVRTSGRVQPLAIIHDPDLFATTPRRAIAGSAMNGFNKGIETIYDRGHAAITDATATRGLELLVDGLPRLGDSVALERAVLGIVLVQYERRVSILHAFGHGFARRYDVQQGVAHAVVTPTVLRYVFDQTDARRDVLAEGLGIDVDGVSDQEIADRVVETVVDVRDALDLPTRIRDLDGVGRGDLLDIAALVADDPLMGNTPPGVDPAVEQVEALLEEAW